MKHMRKYILYILSVVVAVPATFFLLILAFVFIISPLMSPLVKSQNTEIGLVILSWLILGSIPFIIGHYLLRESIPLYRSILQITFLVVITLGIGIAFTGVSRCQGFCPNTRDSKRINDIKITQNYLELYKIEFGHYPGTSDGAVTTTPMTWADLSATLAERGVRIPQDPLLSQQTPRTYYYATNKENPVYILNAILERDGSILKTPEEIDSIPPDFIIPHGMNCDDASFRYCVGN